jgi:glucose/mannose-6-phosphate isomerase
MAVDSLSVLEVLRGYPEQLASAHEAAAVAVDVERLPDASAIDAVVVAAMGGSAAAGDVLTAAAAPACPVPVLVYRGYDLPAFVGPRTLVLAVSYSGDTEETVTAATAALDAGAAVVTISSGGKLAELAAEGRAFHIPCLSGIVMPRFALGALVAPILVTLFRLGLLPNAHANLMGAQDQLAHRRDGCAPEVLGDRNPARDVARRIGRTIPLVYGGGQLGAVASMRWKTAVNENAKAPAFWNTFPELDHNEICGWGQHGDVTRQVVTVVELRHTYEGARVARRVELTRELVAEAVAGVVEVRAAGTGVLAQLLDLIYIGDWASCYLALDNDVDPGPIDVLTHLKTALANDAH